jgi:uncharacterized protein YqiB (DUF1249 family)
MTMARRNIYEMNYARLEKLLGCPPGEILSDGCYRYGARAFMDLVVEVLPRCSHTDATVLSLAHYFRQHGDLCQDPEMTVRVFPPGCDGFWELAPSTDPRHGRVEALSFQQSIPPIYQVVYPEPGRYYPNRKRELNSFLGMWLRNLKEQGHRPVEGDD